MSESSLYSTKKKPEKHIKLERCIEILTMAEVVLS